MADGEQELEVAPLTAEELALRCLEVEAVARGEVLEMNEPSTQETEPREDLTCAICLTATEFAALPCCDSATTTDSTFQCCPECLLELCARGNRQCPRCRAPILLGDYEEAAWEELLAEVVAEFTVVAAVQAYRQDDRRALEADLAAARERLHRQVVLAGRFERIESIGAGVVGTVYRVRDEKTNEILALKRIRFEDGEEGVPVAALREISLLTDIAHPNIVPLRDTHVATSRLFLVLELLDCHLRTYLRERGGLDQQTCANFNAQILAGVAHCHDRQVLHRDLKPENVLVRRQDRTVKIADFGLSRMFSRPQGQHTQEVVTLWYRAPELLLGAERYGTPVDVWSVGCILAEIATARPLFPGDSEIDQLFKIFRVRGTPNDHVWPGVSRLPNYKLEFPQWHEQLLVKAAPALTLPALDLLGRCLAYEPSSRITAREARAHAFIDPLAADRAADRAAAADAARAAAEALKRDWDPTKFGGFHSAFTTPARQKRARLVTPPSALQGPPSALSGLFSGRASETVSGRSCIPGSLRYGVRCDGSEINPGRVSPLLQGLEALYTAADMAED